MSRSEPNAARLEGLAEPGGIFVSATVHDHVVGKLAHRFEDLGEHTFKNIAKPVRVYRAGTGGTQERAAPPALALPELQDHSYGGPNSSNEWARESYQIAVDFAYMGVETLPDPDLGQNTDRLIKNMMKYILEGVAPVDRAPKLPEGYWEKLQLTTAQRITLADYRIADLILLAADNIEAQRKYLGDHRPE